MKPMTRFPGGVRRAFAVTAWIALLSFPAGPGLDFGQEAGGNVLAAPSAAGAEPSQTRRQQPLPPLSPDESPQGARKREREMLKDKFEKMKQNADELAELAKLLQEDLNESNENVLSVEVLQKAQKIEKLAKKIKSAARGF